MLIPEELPLLLPRADGRQESASGYRSYAAIAALIVDLAAAGRVTLSDDKDPKLHLTSADPTGDIVLDAALPELQKRDGKTFSGIVAWTPLDPRDAVTKKLIDAGVLELGERGFFGLGAHRTPEVDPHPEARIRARLSDVIAGRRDATSADRALLAILQATHAARSILKEETRELSSSELRKRIDEIVESGPDGDAAGDAIERAVQQLTMSIVLTTVIPVVIAGTVTGS